MKNFNLNFLPSVKKGLLKKGNGLQANQMSFPWKEKAGGFFNLWAAQTMPPAQTGQKQKAPIVIPVKPTAARFASETAANEKIPSAEPQKAVNSSQPVSKTTKPAIKREKVMSFTLEVPFTPSLNQSQSVAKGQQKSASESGVKGSQTQILTSAQQTSLNTKEQFVWQQKLTEKVVQAAFNSSTLTQEFDKGRVPLVNVQYGLQAEAAQQMQQMVGEKTAAQSTTITWANSGQLFLQKTAKGEWQVVQSQQEAQALLKQFHLQKAPQVELLINSVKEPLTTTRETMLSVEVQPLAPQKTKGKVSKLEPAPTPTISNEEPLAATKEGSRSKIQSTIWGDLKNLPVVNKAAENGQVAPAQTKGEAQPQPSFTKVNLQLSVTPQTTKSASQLSLAQPKPNVKKVQQLNVEIHQIIDSKPAFQNSHHAQPIEAGSRPQLFADVQSIITRIQEVADQVQSMKLRNSQINLSLDDTPLGKMDLQFKQNERHLTIVVENEQAKAELVKLTPLIQQNLSEKGLQLTGFQVNVGQFGQPEGQGKHDSAKKHHRLNVNTQNGKEVGEHETSSTIVNRKFGYNTMEITV